MNKLFIALIIIIISLFLLFGVNAMNYSSNSLSFQLNNFFINSNIIVIGIIFIVFLIMVYIGYRIVVR